MERIIIVKLYGRLDYDSFEQYIKRFQNEIQSEHIMAIIIDFCNVEINKESINIARIKNLKSIFLRETKNFIIADNPMSTVLGMLYKQTLKEQGLECKVFSYIETVYETLDIQDSDSSNCVIKQGDLSSFNQSYQEHGERLFKKSKDILVEIVHDVFINN